MLQKDPLNNAVSEIKRGIRLCIDNKCGGSAVILIYSGIDTMAFLGMPSNQVEVTRRDFESWCDKYVRFSGKQQLTGQELYGARCGMLHTYGIESRSSRAGACRKLGYMDRPDAEIWYDPKFDPNVAVVSIEALAKAFFAGIDRYLVELFADSTRTPVAEKRVQDLLACFHVKDVVENGVFPPAGYEN